jgi:hypothetical protein
MLKFLVTAGQKGWIKPNTASALKGACKRVLGVLDPGEKVDVAKIDVEAVLGRFANTNSGVSSQSLRVYGSRIRSAIKTFTDAKANPTAWNPPSSRAGRSKTNAKAATEKAGGAKKPAPKHEKPHESRGPETAPRDEVAEALGRGLSYPFPLRADVTITISDIPRDLRATEVDRIAQFLKALALGDQKA